MEETAQEKLQKSETEKEKKTDYPTFGKLQHTHEVLSYLL
jgi:hypothetical protein